MKTRKNRIVLSLVSALLTLSSLLLFAGCSFGLKTYSEELSAGYERTAPKQGAPSDEFRLAAANFALALARASITKDGASGVSPLSALWCLGLLAEGTAGETRAELERALGVDVETLSKGLQAFGDGLYSSKECKVQFANSLWIKDVPDFKPNEQFLKNNAEYFGAQIYKGAFDSNTIKDINNWVDHYTDGMIKKIVERFQPNDLVYLINTLLFDAKWENKYESKDVKDADFTCYNGSKKTVKMMYSDESKYLADDRADGFLKPYDAKETTDGGTVAHYAFLGLLPKEGVDVYEYLASLDSETWRALLGSAAGSEVKAGIPEFSVQSDLDLKKILSDMGYAPLFSTNADLSALGECENGLYVSEMNQKLKIEVDRNGTKAAAVTWAVVERKSAAPVEFHRIILDRPFIYAIVDLTTNLPLFIGVQANI